MDFDILSDIPLFRGCTRSETEAILGFLNYTTRCYEKGAFVYSTESVATHMGIVLSGNVQVEHTDAWGNRTILNIVEGGGMLADVFAFLPDQPLLVNAIAHTDCEVLFLDVPKLLCMEPTPLDQVRNRLIRNLLALGAQHRLHLLNRAFHTAPKTIRGRVISYLSEQADRQGGSRVTIPYDRQQLADYLGLDRSALSKELGKMKKDGLLDYHKNIFELKTPQPTKAESGGGPTAY